MSEYPKIRAPFRRQEAKPHRVLEGEWTSPELEYLAELDWRWTEKVDGTNVRVGWDGHRVTFGGRTDRAQLPVRLVQVLEDTFHAAGVEEVFEQTWGETPAVLYGEGYGAGIQKGGCYRPDVGFVLFDVRVGRWWLRREDVEVVGRTLDLDVVPERIVCSVWDAVSAVRVGLTSAWGDFPAEGLVGTPYVPLSDRGGRRLTCKVKAADFPG